MMVRASIHCALALLPSAASLRAERELVSFASADPHDMPVVGSEAVGLSPDGRFVLVESRSPHLLAPGVDDNDCADLFLHDRTTGQLELLSRFASQPLEARCGTTGLFSSPGLLSQQAGVVIYQEGFGRWIWFDRAAGTRESFSDLITVAGQPVVVIAPSALTPSGRHLAFEYRPDDDGQNQIGLFDDQTGTGKLVTHVVLDPAAPTPHATSFRGLTPDGRFVLFSSVGAVSFVAGVTKNNGFADQDLFLHDVVTGARLLVSRAASQPLQTADDTSESGLVATDGSVVAFTSQGTNLAGGQTDTANTWDVFAFNVATGTTTLISHAVGQATTAAGGRVAAVSAAGRFILFESESTNLVAGQVDGVDSQDLFLHDRVADITVLVSHVAGQPATAAAAPSQALSLSEDGRFVFFTSTASNLVAGLGTLATNLFRFDRATGEVMLVSHRPDQPLGAAGVSRATIDRAGQVAAVTSADSGVAAPLRDYNHTGDSFVYDLGTGSLETLAPAGYPITSTAAWNSAQPAVSADGGVVAYGTMALDMVPGFGPAPISYYAVAFDRGARRHELLSHAAGEPASPRAVTAVRGISADGRFVLLGSRASDLSAGQVETVADSEDVFVYDRQTRTTELVSHFPGQPTSAGGGVGFGLSDEGRYVLFASATPGLVPGVDPLGRFQLYLHDRQTGTRQLASRGFGSATEPADTSEDLSVAFREARVSANGRLTMFWTKAPNLSAGDTNQTLDVFAFDRETGLVRLVSHPPGSSTPFPSAATGPRLAAGGRFVAFEGQGPQTIYLWDALDGETRKVFSHSTAALRDLTSDGRHLLFDTEAAGAPLPGLDLNSGYDAFLYDRETETFRLVSHRFGDATRTGTYGIDRSFGLSDDGRRVLLLAEDTSLVPSGFELLGRGGDLLLRTLQSGTTELVSYRETEPQRGGGIDAITPTFAWSRDGHSLAMSIYSNAWAPVDLDQGGITDFGFATGGADVFLFRSSQLFADDFESGHLAAWSTSEP
jgi:Tol biopolymer transport system component